MTDSFGSEFFYDSFADTFAAASDQRCLATQIQVHVPIPFLIQLTSKVGPDDG